MKPVEAIGKTVEEAVKSGLSDLGLTRDEAEIEILDEGSKGLFGLVGEEARKGRCTPTCQSGC